MAQSTIPGRPIGLPAVLTPARLPGRGASVADLAAELATLPTPAIAEQIIGLAEAPAELHDVAAARFHIAAVTLARRMLAPPPRRRQSAAELGQRLIEAVADYAATNGLDGDAKLTCYMTEWLDWRDRITPAGRKALARLEAAS